MNSEQARMLELNDKKARRQMHPGKSINMKSFFKIAVAMLIVAVIATCGLLFYKSSVSSYIDGGKYQSVFLTNGQVYFGKLSKLSGDYFKLTDIFYLQTQTTSTSSTVQAVASSSDANVQLIKLGNEIHGPEDAMIINKDQILFFENTKADGKVTAAIKEYYNKK
jgi:hypothetical protein